MNTRRYVPMKSMTRSALTGAMLATGLWPCGAAAAPMTETRLAGLLDAYNVVWDSPSQDANGSMPLGNGDVGLNAWVEASGDLVFYISKTDAWDENARLCKIGRVRVKFEPALQAGASLRQELKLREGAIEIQSTVDGQPALIRLWVDADRPIVRVQAETKARAVCRAAVELWRQRERPFGPDDSHSGNGVNQLPGKPTVLPDEVVTGEMPRVAWFHRNTRSLYEPVLEAQNLAALKGRFPDPLLNHTFGASLRGAKMIKDSPRTLKSVAPATQHELAVCVVAEQTATSGEWVAKLDRAEHGIWRTSFDRARRATADSWRDFWQRSYVFVEEPGDAAAPGQSPVTRGYLLQRFISAAAARGGSPIKFNGTIFTVEARPGASPETPDGDPDWRRWGGNYWFQNTRLVYWPMLASGNYDMMLPLFRMFQAAMPLSMARAKAYFNLDGAAVFPETMYFWGLPSIGDFGLNNPGPDLSNSYIRRHWNNGLELTALMLEYFHHTQDETFVRDTLLPVAEPLVAFFGLYWPKRDAEGKIVFEPSQALETYQDAMNPLPDIAGLRYVLPRLLALPAKLTTEAQRTRWTRLLEMLPPIPMAEADGGKVLRPAARHGGGANFENPELYGAFPFKLFGVGSPDVAIGRTTFNRRTHRQNRGWCKDSIQAACLGLGDEAARLLADRARQINQGSRFPAFWGPNYDWVPDQDHGGNLVNTLQLMLLQYDTASTPTAGGGKIFVLPAWPKNWNAVFKLHAPHNTTVEGEVRDGKLIHLKVTPASRAADVVNLAEQPEG